MISTIPACAIISAIKRCSVSFIAHWLAQSLISVVEGGLCSKLLPIGRPAFPCRWYSPVLPRTFGISWITTLIWNEALAQRFLLFQQRGTPELIPTAVRKQNVPRA